MNKIKEIIESLLTEIKNIDFKSAESAVIGDLLTFLDKIVKVKEELSSEAVSRCKDNPHAVRGWVLPVASSVRKIVNEPEAARILIDVLGVDVARNCFKIALVNTEKEIGHHFKLAGQGAKIKMQDVLGDLLVVEKRESKTLKPDPLNV